MTQTSLSTRAIRIDRHGGPEELKLVEVEVGEPGPGEIRIRHKAIGLNFIDVYQRSGLYPFAMPLQLGMEAAGVVEAVGEGVTHLQPGDRAAYASAPPGSLLRAARDAGQDGLQAARCHQLRDRRGDDAQGPDCAVPAEEDAAPGGLHKGDFVLFHAAAGGVGLIACQWAKALGLQLIGTAGSGVQDSRWRKARRTCHQLQRLRSFAARVKEITGGAGVKVVYDSVGKDTYEGSIDCLRPFGLLAVFGNGSGPVPPINLGTLASKGSLYVTRPTLFTHMSTRESTQAMADDLFAVVQSGAVKIPIEQRYALADVQQAHRDLEARKTTGCTILTL
jgi:NADPH2:quinone reductase